MTAASPWVRELNIRKPVQTTKICRLLRPRLFVEQGEVGKVSEKVVVVVVVVEEEEKKKEEEEKEEEEKEEEQEE